MAGTPVILMIDDNSGEALLLREALADFGLANDFHHAANAEEAYDFLHQDGLHADAPRPSLILLDVKIPGESGLDILRHIKEEPELSDIPVVLTSTLASEAEIREGEALGAADYVSKPEGFDGYIALIERLKSLLDG